jgi:hypothetical protein
LRRRRTAERTPTRLLLVLQFDRPISRSYFEFVIALWTHQRLFDPFVICETRRSNDRRVRDDHGVIVDVRDLEERVDERRAATRVNEELRARTPRHSESRTPQCTRSRSSSAP